MFRFITDVGGGIFGLIIALVAFSVVAMAAAVILGVSIWLGVEVLRYLDVDIAFLWDGR